MPATLTRRHMEPLEQAGSRYAELMRLAEASHTRSVAGQGLTNSSLNDKSYQELAHDYVGAIG